MNKHVILLALIAVFLFHGCKGKPESNNSVQSLNIKLDLQKKMKSIHDIELIKEVKIVEM